MPVCNHCKTEYNEGDRQCAGCGRLLPVANKKKNVSVRLYPEQKQQAEKEHGSIQKAIDFIYKHKGSHE